MAFQLDRSPLSPETQEIAEKELRETPEVVQQALAELRELLKNDDTIYFADDDETLIIFLRPCKFYAKSAYELVKICLIMHLVLITFFRNRLSSFNICISILSDTQTMRTVESIDFFCGTFNCHCLY